MIATRSKNSLTTGRNCEGVDLLHFHDLSQHYMRMQFGFLSDRATRRNEHVLIGTLAMDDKVGCTRRSIGRRRS